MENSELIFFDTFAHGNSEDIKLDLVQFPQPVHITEVRVIPLGARVEANFPGGVRLGATNPSQFRIEFFVNDLGRLDDSTFRSLGGFDYNEQSCINMMCNNDSDGIKVLTDGLVLKGLYTTITLAVYGSVTNNIVDTSAPDPISSSPNNSVTVNELDTCESWSIKEVGFAAPTSDNRIQESEDFQTVYNRQTSEPSQDRKSSIEETQIDPRTSYNSDNDQGNKIVSEHDTTYKKISVGTKQYKLQKIDETSFSPEAHNTAVIDTVVTITDQYVGVEDETIEKQPSKEVKKDVESELKAENLQSKVDDFSSPDSGNQANSAHLSPRDSVTKNTVRTSDDNRLSPDTNGFVQKYALISCDKESHSSLDATGPNTAANAIQEPETSPLSEVEFEPILSDDDMLDDDDQFVDTEVLDYNDYVNNDEFFKTFQPKNITIKQINQLMFITSSDQIIVHFELCNAIGVLYEYFHGSITAFKPHNFLNINSELREEFVHLCEKLPSLSVSTIDNITQLFELHAHLQESNEHRLQVIELAKQLHIVVNSLLDWLSVALRYEYAIRQVQPPYKIRHIKSGVRLLQLCLFSGQFIRAFISKTHNDIPTVLFNLYTTESMALSIRLQSLRCLEIYLSHKFTMQTFLTTNNSHFGYTKLIELLLLNPSIRLKFFLYSILQKIHIYELLQKLETVTFSLVDQIDVSTDDCQFIIYSLHLIVDLLIDWTDFRFDGRKYFLPIITNSQSGMSGFTCSPLIQLLKISNILSIVNILLSHPKLNRIAHIRTHCLEIITWLHSTQDGLRYLSQNINAVNVLIGILCTDENTDAVASDHPSNIVANLSYKLQTYYYLDSIARKGENTDGVIECLHQLCCLCMSPVGRAACCQVLQYRITEVARLSVLSMQENMVDGLLIYQYVVELMYFLLAKSYKVSGTIIEHVDTFLKACNSLQSDDGLFLTKLDAVNSFVLPKPVQWNDITILMETISSKLNVVHELPADVVTSVRLLKEFATTSNENRSRFNQLQSTHTLLQLLSLDGVMTFTKVLKNITQHFDQPVQHLNALTCWSSRGCTVLEVLGCAVNLIHDMLKRTFVCCQSSFKDLTPVPVLLSVYNLLECYQVTNPLFAEAQTISERIIKTLLLYTTATTFNHDYDNQSIVKRSIWSQMLREVFDFTLRAPYRIAAGLQILNALLPLPLPIQSFSSPSEDETKYVIDSRKNWARQLSVYTRQIEEIITTTCITNYPEMLHILQKVCIQIGDLDANLATVVVKSVLDPCQSLGKIHPETKLISINTEIWRNNIKRLHFLSTLVDFGSIKCVVLNILFGNNSELQLLIDLLYYSLRNISLASALQCILKMFEIFCNHEITLLQQPTKDKNPFTSELYLANSLLTKDILLSFLSTILNRFDEPSGFEHLSQQALGTILHIFLLLCEHNFGYNCLKEQLLMHSGILSKLLDHIMNTVICDDTKLISDRSNEGIETLQYFFQLLRMSTHADNTETLIFSKRSMLCTYDELKLLLAWNDDTHKLLQLRDILQEIQCKSEVLSNILEGVKEILSILMNPQTFSTKSTNTSVYLPEPLSLNAQFSGRLIYANINECSSDRSIETWCKTSPMSKFEVEESHVDIFEILKQCQISNFDVIREVESVCNYTGKNANENLAKHHDHLVGDDVSKILKVPNQDSAGTAKISSSLIDIPTDLALARGRSSFYAGRSAAHQRGSDSFRSRPPNTSRPPSLHVDDFVALETCSTQPNGPLGYNKFSRDIQVVSRTTRRDRLFLHSAKTT